jgi:hypothetical protein
MLRALLVIALVFGVIIGGLLLLKRTSTMGVPRPGAMPRKQIKGPGEKEDEEDRSGW